VSIYPIYELFFDNLCLIFFIEELDVLGSIRNWYLEQDGNYICIYIYTLAIHILLKNVPYTLLFTEVGYQLAKFEANSKLKEHKKDHVPSLPLHH
jgi:hypothetical protein